MFKSAPAGPVDATVTACCDSSHAPRYFAREPHRGGTFEDAVKDAAFDRRATAAGRWNVTEFRDAVSGRRRCL